jgi:uncharacterized protein YyaL (SSP411 family)
MAQNLYHLGILFDDDVWKKLAEDMTYSLSYLITSEPNYMSNWGIVYTEMKKGMAEVAFVGPDARSRSVELEGYQPFVVAMGTESESTLPLLEGKIPLDGKLTIYVCYNKTCQRPVHDLSEAAKQIV